MDPGRKYKDTKRCIVCDIVKKLSKNFRTINNVGHTSKTCYTCECKANIHLVNDNHKA